MTSSLIGTIRVYGSGGTTSLIIVIFILLGMAYWRRYRRVSGGFEESRSYGLAHAVGSAIALGGELIALLLAWLVVTHASTRLVGAVLSVLLGAVISASVFSAASNRVSKILSSFTQWIGFNPRPASIAAIVSFVIGFFFGSLGGGILLAGVGVAVTTGKKARDATKRVRALRDETAGDLAATLGISLPALEDLSWYVMPDRTIVVERPGAALLNADRLHERVAKLLPYLEVSEASPSQIVLSPLSIEVADLRAHVQLSGGLVTGTADATSTPPALPKAHEPDVPQHTISLEDL